MQLIKRIARRFRVEIQSARARFACWLIDKVKSDEVGTSLVYRLCLLIYSLKRAVQLIATQRRWPSFACWRFFSREIETHFLIRLVVWRDWPIREPVNLYTTFRQNNRLLDAEIQAMRERIPADGPLVSVVVPVYNAERVWIDRLVQSLTDQTYDRWELILVDDGSTFSDTLDALEWARRRDDRISVYSLPSNQGVVETTNRGVDWSHGQWIAFADHDDELMPDALWWVAREAVAGGADVIYTDEEIHHDDTGMAYPHLKPGYSPQQLQSHNYICHLLVVRRELFEAVGKLRPGTEGAQDFDLVLRLSEKTDRFVHIPRILYRWHVVARSMSRFVDPKTQKLKQTNHLDETTRKVVQEHFERIGSNATVGIVGHWAWPSFPPCELGRVTIIICTKDQPTRLARCIESIEANTDYPDYQILIIDNGSQRPASRQLLDKLRDRHRVERIESGPEGFNFSYLNNQGARLADSPMILFLNDDTVVLKRGWLSAMVGTLQLPSVEVVGARLLYPNRLNQHAGLILGALGWGPWHALIGLPADTQAYGGYLTFPHNSIAVTGACLLTRRKTFFDVGGFDAKELAVSFNDVDFCLRVHALGGSIAYAPQAELIHDEGISRGRFARPAEVAQMKRRGYGLADPYWNPQYSRLTPHLALSPRRRSRGLGITRRPRVLFLPDTDHSSEIGPLLESLAMDGAIEIIPDHPEATGNDADLLVVEGIGDAEVWSRIDRSATLGLPILWGLPERLMLPPLPTKEERARLLEALERFPLAYQVVFGDPFSIGWGASGLPRPNLDLVPRTLEFEPDEFEVDQTRRDRARKHWGLAAEDVCLWAPVSANDQDSTRFLVDVFGKLPTDLRRRCRLIVEWDQPPTSSDLRTIRPILQMALDSVAVVGPAEEHVLSADIVLAHELVEPRPERVMLGLAHSLPVIGTPLIEQGDLIHRPPTGRVAPSFAKSAWLAAIEELVSETARRREMGREGRHWLISRETRRDALKHWRELIMEGAELGLAAKRSSTLPLAVLEEKSPELMLPRRDPPGDST
jgi:GT2 family glycosyltransferase